MIAEMREKLAAVMGQYGDNPWHPAKDRIDAFEHAISEVLTQLDGLGAVEGWQWARTDFLHSFYVGDCPPTMNDLAVPAVLLIAGEPKE